MGRIEARLKELGIVLARPPQAVANYIPGIKVAEIPYLAGPVGTVVGANDEELLAIKGTLGNDPTLERGHQSARLTAINRLAMIKAVIGDLDEVVRIARVIGYVNPAPVFQTALLRAGSKVRYGREGGIPMDLKPWRW